MALVLAQSSNECQLLGEFGVIIQVVLGLMSFSSLISNPHIVKRYCDKKRRSWKIWFFDTSKQASSAGMLHCLNIGAAVVIGDMAANPCTWYFLNFSIDTLLGMMVCYLLLRALEKCVERSETARFESGNYGDPPRWTAWLYQLWVWLIISLLMKGIVIMFIVIFREPLQFFGDMLLSPVSGYPDLELVLVMIIIPVVLNSLMFWVTDSFLKLAPANRVKTQSGHELEELAEYLPLE